MPVVGRSHLVDAGRGVSGDIRPGHGHAGCLADQLGDTGGAVPVTETAGDFYPNAVSKNRTLSPVTGTSFATASDCKSGYLGQFFGLNEAKIFL